MESINGELYSIVINNQKNPDAFTLNAVCMYVLVAVPM
jgi:hypothetical protein